ncbi:MAG: hypothetical protein HY851_11230 [candidate division Zixibacteria bacterium]|nr:hypothetical protein [candidate division Zixibacteria bacterium]
MVRPFRRPRRQPPRTLLSPHGINRKECRISGKIDILNLSIGRGHPFYLDGIISALIRRGAVSLLKGQVEVFDICSGLSRAGWHTARWLYHHGASNPIVGALYHLIRRQNDYNKPSVSLRILGRPLIDTFGPGSDPLIVSHPMLVGILANRPNLLYQHGELVAPDESLVRGASVVFVPTHDVAERFLSAGYSRGQILVTGLCIEPPLTRTAEDMYLSRINRLQSTDELCGLFVSSGAEPSDHINALVTSALSALKSGGKAVILVREGGKLEYRITSALHSEGILPAIVNSATPIPTELPQATIVSFTTRREENNLTECLFRHLDYFVSPAHERINWAMGLGLPMFVLTPSIGPFAPLNLELVKSAGVGRIIGDQIPPSDFGPTLERLRRSGELSAMAERGWQERPIDGFQRIADYLITHFQP